MIVEINKYDKNKKYCHTIQLFAIKNVIVHINNPQINTINDTLYYNYIVNTIESAVV